jgi:hypothetical protein
MLDTLAILPFSFWAVIALLAFGVIQASGQIRRGTGLPLLAVLGTAAAWYAGDALYNNYATNHALTFTPEVLDRAWWQVALFLVALLVFTPVVHSMVNSGHRRRTSAAYEMFRSGIKEPLFQRRIDRMFLGCALLWGVLSVVAAIRLKGEALYYFIPYLDYMADPWGRGRVGGGYDALLSLAGYLEMFVACLFGIVLAVATNPRVRFLALAGCVAAWPYFLFSRARNVMLAVVIPSLLAWVFLRLRGGLTRRMGVLCLGFLVVNAWFGFVLTNRSTMSMTEALKEEGLDLEHSESVHHEGLNMYEELCWINSLIGEGTYRPDWGRRYFAELVNPIPRSLWAGKPLIGIDYAKVRGQAYEQGEAGVAATISTGMIGQGAVNFGPFLGPVFAAFLMSLWVAILARLDLHGDEVGRLPLFILGLTMTFNLGRDITFITLYTFVFGAAVVWWLDRRAAQEPGRRSPATPAAKAPAEKSGPRNGRQRSPASRRWEHSGRARRPACD